MNKENFDHVTDSLQGSVDPLRTPSLLSKSLQRFDVILRQDWWYTEAQWAVGKSCKRDGQSSFREAGRAMASQTREEWKPKRSGPTSMFREQEGLIFLKSEVLLTMVIECLWLYVTGGRVKDDAINSLALYSRVKRAQRQPKVNGVLYPVKCWKLSNWTEIKQSRQSQATVSRYRH